MDTNWEESGEDVGCAIEVLNRLGYGLIEKPYENALVVEFGLRNIPFRQQPAVDVVYKGQKVGLFIPDLIGVILNFKHRKLEWQRIAL
jgi:GxxExxY protein